MVKMIHCSACYKTSEIDSDNDTDAYDEASYCPFCGHQEEQAKLLIEEEFDEEY